MENNKVYAALSSLARFLDFKENKAPEIIVNLEKDLLFKRFNGLSKDEFEEVRHMWPSFYEDRQASLDIEALIIQESFERHDPEENK